MVRVGQQMQLTWTDVEDERQHGGGILCVCYNATAVVDCGWDRCHV